MDIFVPASFEPGTDQRVWEGMDVLVEEFLDAPYGNGTKRAVDEWFLMGSPWPVVVIATMYLYFVLALGPRLMSTKPPYKLKIPILAYNLGMVVFSSWWVYQVVSDGQIIACFISSACRPSKSEVSPLVNLKTDALSWFYLMSKYVELLDTVFFVLRRKQNQVTFLHVYHHTNMAVFTWVFVKYVIGSQILLVGLVNSFVHVVMYSYYLLAGLGPQIQKYLWWKRYITRLQIGQFLFVICYLVLLLTSGCEIKRPFIIFAVCNTFVFLYLFMDFYRNAYKKRQQKTE